MPKLLVQGPHFENPWLGIRESSGHYTREGGRFSSKGGHIPEADGVVTCSPDYPTLGSTALVFREVQGSFQRSSGKFSENFPPRRTHTSSSHSGTTRGLMPFRRILSAISEFRMQQYSALLRQGLQKQIRHSSRPGG